MSVFGDTPWLIWLCYAVAAMALGYAIQLQISLRPGGKPIRGVPMWREDLSEPVVKALQGVLPPAHYTGFDNKSNRLTTALTPENEATFLYVVRTKGHNPPAPFNGTLKSSASGVALYVRHSPLVPLVYLGLVIIVWTVMGGGPLAWMFAGLVALLFGYTLYRSRQVLLDGLKIIKDSNRVIEPETSNVQS